MLLALVTASATSLLATDEYTCPAEDSKGVTTLSIGPLELRHFRGAGCDNFNDTWWS